MKIKQVIPEDIEKLDELAMNPKSLRAMAAQTGAIAGMEFEMIVPDIETSDDAEMVMDMSEDRYARSIDDVANFYYSDYNSSRQINTFREQLEEEYQRWRDLKILEYFEKNAEDHLEKYIRENELDVDDIIEMELEEMGLTPQQIRVALNIGKNVEKTTDDDNQEELFSDKKEALESYKKALKKANDEVDEMVGEALNYKDRVWDAAFEEFREENSDTYEETDWFEENGTERLSDFQRYDLNWPYWEENTRDSSFDIQEISTNFGEVIGRPVKYSSRYHGARRDDDSYVIEPDGSIESDDGGTGLEFVSPPLPIDELLSDLKTVVKWARDNGCYTNNSTGLHMNISIPGIEHSKVDPLKLILLSGDRYVLEIFGRESNSYAVSSLNRIQNAIKKDPEFFTTLLPKMHTDIKKIASKLLTSKLYEKYSSINLSHKNYVEIRSPGGDWLDDDLEKLENTLLRFVVAYDAAAHPEKYRNEYLKKLYKLLNVKSNDDVLYYFSNYAAGELDKESLKRLVKSKRSEIGYTSKKQPIKSPSSDSVKYRWSVSANEYPSYKVEVTASSENDAKMAAFKATPEWGNAGISIRELNASIIGNG